MEVQLKAEGIDDDDVKIVEIAGFQVTFLLSFSHIISLFLSLSLFLAHTHTHTLLRKKRATTKSAKNIDLPQVTGADVTGVAEVHGLTDHRAVNARSPKHNIH